jgi:ubiquinone/menaquinone biosynthesis C-methylase UbiE
MNHATPTPTAVKDHYQRLAPEYNTRANRTCEWAYRLLVRRTLGGRRCLLELGGGSTDLLDELGSSSAVASDLSLEMLRQRPGGASSHRVVASGERLPFGDGRFEGVFSINVLEHVADLDRFLDESTRVLAPGGTWLAITPNGDWEFWLDLAERWRLKIPEGPHRFLTIRRLSEAVRARLELVEHRTMLFFPCGPPALAALVDRLTLSTRLGWGFFQYVVARRHGPAA